MLDVRRVLRGNNDVRDAHGLIIDVLDGDLTFGIGTKPLHLAALANASQLAAKLVGVHDWRGHQLGSFIRRISKHEPLIAGALFRLLFAVGGARVHAGDVGALSRDET